MSKEEEGEAVQVAVRMRVFNEREKRENASLIIRMTKEEKGSHTFITNPETNEEKKFAFDFSFNSHEDRPAVGPYATQDTVFNELGKPVLDLALEGRNICLFAYGQTGAGKSFSMLGKTDIPQLQGIIPRTCKRIFETIDESKGNDLIKASVSIQVVEVYCEQINDLLADRKHWPPGGFKPRMGKDGFSVDTVIQPCMNFEDIEKAFKFADKNRSVGSHALNPESSRAHTIYTIKYERKTRVSATAKQEEVVTSRINLVDLAGSERTESAGTSGQMLKEGNAINQSLTSLGNCIHALSEGSRPNFRDSKLTLLLQGSMTNGKVIMIAAVSPASICFEESMSTLRFAERIKLVKIKAKKNVTLDPVAEIKKEMEEMRARMQQEIDELRAASSGKPGASNAAADPEELNRLKQLLAEQEQNEKALREDLERQVKELAQTEIERAAQAQKNTEQWRQAIKGVTDERKEDIKDPHLLNLNPEPRLAETLIYKLKPGTTVAGRANKENPPDLEFSGMGMMKDHCTFIWDGNKVLIVGAPGARCLVNGKQIGDSAELKHNFRVWLGNNYAFRFAFPGHEAQGEAFDGEERKPDYFFAEAEIAAEVAKATGADGEAGGQLSGLNHKLSEALKKVEQANIISGDLNRDVLFKPKIISNRATGEKLVVVHVALPQGTLTWPWEKFNVRLVDMVKCWEAWQYASNNDQEYKLADDENNPFIDNDYQLIGEADVWLQPLGNMIDIQVQPPVLNISGAKEGELAVRIGPLDAKGEEGPWDVDDDDAKADLDPFVEDPSELLQKEIGFVIRVDELRFDVDLSNGGKSKYKDTWVRYKILAGDLDEEFTETAHDPGSSIDPKYNHTKRFKRFVDQEFLRHIQKGKITFQVWGKLVEDKGVGKGAGLPPGWKRVTAFQDPDGQLHLELPKK